MGPLKDIKILEFSGIGPGPYCGMLLADLGADVIRISRKETQGLESKFDVHNRSKSCLLYTSPSPRDAESSRMPSSA